MLKSLASHFRTARQRRGTATDCLGALGLPRASLPATPRSKVSPGTGVDLGAAGVHLGHDLLVEGRPLPAGRVDVERHGAATAGVGHLVQPDAVVDVRERARAVQPSLAQPRLYALAVCRDRLVRARARLRLRLRLRLRVRLRDPNPKPIPKPNRPPRRRPSPPAGPRGRA